MTRLHPDDIQAIAARVVLLISLPIPPYVPAGEDYVSPAEEARIRLLARQNVREKALHRARRSANGRLS